MITKLKLFLNCTWVHFFNYYDQLEWIYLTWNLYMWLVWINIFVCIVYWDLVCFKLALQKQMEHNLKYSSVLQFLSTWHMEFFKTPLVTMILKHSDLAFSDYKPCSNPWLLWPLIVCSMSIFLRLSKQNK